MTAAVATMQKAKLKDICDRITVGHVGAMADKYTPEGVPFLRSQNITPFRLHLDDMKFVPREFHESLRKSALRPGDVAVVRTGYPGTACVIPQSLPESNCADLVVITPSKKLNPYYLAAIFNSAWGKASVAGNLVGVAQQHFNIGAAREMEVILPSRRTQDHIAEVLAAYDDQMENCRRRIQILEEMARLLYREWFVHFRFPGQESAARVALPLGTIPCGWEIKPFSSLATYVNGYAFKPTDWGTEGKPIIKIRELKAGISAETPRNPGDGIPEKYFVRDGDLLFSWSADLDAYLWMGGDGLLNQHLFNVVPVNGHGRAFCYYALKQAMPRFRALSLGATMHHIKRSALDQVSAVIPPATVRTRFESLVAPIHRQMVVLSKRSTNLRLTRTLLLPRLLSGESPAL